MTNEHLSSLFAVLLLIFAVLIGSAIIFPISTCHLSRSYCNYAIAGPTKYDYDSVSMIGSASEDGTILVERKKFLLSAPSLQFFKEGAKRPYYATEYIESFAPIFDFSEDRRQLATLFLTRDRKDYDFLFGLGQGPISRSLDFELLYTDLDTEAFNRAVIECDLVNVSDVIEVSDVKVMDEERSISIEFGLPCKQLFVNRNQIGFVKEDSSGTLIVQVDERGNFSEFTSLEFLEYQKQAQPDPRSAEEAVGDRFSQDGQGEIGWLETYDHYTTTISDTGVPYEYVEKYLVGRDQGGELVLQRLSFSRYDAALSAGMSKNFAAFYKNVDNRYDERYRSDQVDGAPLTAQRYDIYLFEDEQLSFEVRLPTFRNRIEVVEAGEDRVQIELFADADELMINGIRFDLPVTPQLGSEDGYFKGRFQVVFADTGRPLSFDQVSQ